MPTLDIPRSLRALLNGQGRRLDFLTTAGDQISGVVQMVTDHHVVLVETVFHDGPLQHQLHQLDLPLDQIRSSALS